MNHPSHRGLCCWPGLTGLWMRGQWNSLVLAVAFSIMFNLTLACSFIWPELLGETFLLAAWPVLIVTWCLSFWISWKSTNSSAETRELSAEDHDTLFIHAQTEYLNGNFSGCLQMLSKHLTDNPRDLESRLLLATTCRRLGRLDEAFHQLATFRKIDGWQQWRNEVQHELQLIEYLSDDLSDDNSIEADSDHNDAVAGTTESRKPNIDNMEMDESEPESLQPRRRAA